jgi:hypothetical protein
MMLHRSQISAPAQSDTVRNLPAVAERHDLVTVPAAIPAAWPAGASQLAIAIAVCQRSNDVEVRSDWLAAARG